jgi:hypothetical protein
MGFGGLCSVGAPGVDAYLDGNAGPGKKKTAMGFGGLCSVGAPGVDAYLDGKPGP